MVFSIRFVFKLTPPLVAMFILYHAKPNVKHTLCTIHFFRCEKQMFVKVILQNDNFYHIVIL